MPSTHNRALAILPSRAPGARPRRVKKDLGTRAEGREAPGLIGDPGNNVGCEAGESGGLIGPRSGLAFVWDKALQLSERFSQPHSLSQLDPVERREEDSGRSLVGGGMEGRLPKLHSGPGASRSPAVSFHPI